MEFTTLNAYLTYAKSFAANPLAQEQIEAAIRERADCLLSQYWAQGHDVETAEKLVCLQLGDAAQYVPLQKKTSRRTFFLLALFFFAVGVLCTGYWIFRITTGRFPGADEWFGINSWMLLRDLAGIANLGVVFLVVGGVFCFLGIAAERPCACATDTFAPTAKQPFINVEHPSAATTPDSLQTLNNWQLFGISSLGLGAALCAFYIPMLLRSSASLEGLAGIALIAAGPTLAIVGVVLYGIGLREKKHSGF